jgi:hypothetical protein
VFDSCFDLLFERSETMLYEVVLYNRAGVAIYASECVAVDPDEAATECIEEYEGDVENIERWEGFEVNRVF